MLYPMVHGQHMFMQLPHPHSVVWPTVLVCVSSELPKRCTTEGCFISRARAPLASSDTVSFLRASIKATTALDSSIRPELCECVERLNSAITASFLPSAAPVVGRRGGGRPPPSLAGVQAPPILAFIGGGSIGGELDVFSSMEEATGQIHGGNCI